MPPIRITFTIAGVTIQADIVFLNSAPAPVLPSPPAAPGSQCGRDIVGLLQEVGERLTTSQIVAGMAEHGMVWSESTITKTVCAMKKQGLLTNATDGHGRGYGLPEWN